MSKQEFQSTIEEQSFVDGFLSQMKIMLKRNTILQYRYLNATIAQVFIAPFLFTLLIFVLQAADHANQRITNAHPPLGSLGGINRCQGRNPGEPCASILYHPQGSVNNVNYDDIMKTFAEKNAERTGFTFQIEEKLTGICN